MVENYLPLLIVVAVSLFLGCLILGLSMWAGPRRPSKIKGQIFECGNEPTGPARDRFNVKFYLVAILFLVFDIEAVFIYPWAVIFSDSIRGQNKISPVLAIVEMFAFVAIVLIGLVYAWRKGALEWGAEPALSADKPHGIHQEAA